MPANRIGSYEFTAAQLKIIQEVITLVVFSVFSVLYLKQQFQWNYVVAFFFLVGAVFFVFYDGNKLGDKKDTTKIGHESNQRMIVSDASARASLQ